MKAITFLAALEFKIAPKGFSSGSWQGDQVGLIIADSSIASENCISEGHLTSESKKKHYIKH